MSRIRSSLRYKIGALMLLLSLGPLVLVGLIGLIAIYTQLQSFSARIGESENSLRTDVVGSNLKGAAVDTAAEIDSYLLDRITDVRRWSEDQLIVEAARQGTLAAQRDRLINLSPDALKAKLQSGLFISTSVNAPASSMLFKQIERPESPVLEIVVTDASGINVLITRPLARLTHADEAWWQAASVSTRGIGVEDVYVDPETELPVIGIALPVVDPDDPEHKRILGVIRALFRLSELQRRVSQKAASLGADIRVFAHDGRLIADTVSNHSVKFILSADGNVIHQNYQPALRALKARPGMKGAGFTTVERTALQRDIVGYAHTSGSNFFDAPAQVSSFDGFEWGVSVAQPEQKALQVLASLIETANAFAGLPTLLGGLIVGVIVLAAIVTLIGAIVLSGGISNPLIHLSQLARRVQEGELSARAEISSQDEVGVLEGAFNTMITGLRERERERDIFGRVVSPEVREKLLDGQLELGGETRWVSVLFADIRDFSTISEQLSPQEAVAFLNEYLTEMAEAIKPWGGYINNFIGDAIVVIFGAPIDQPDKEWRAVSAALTMRERLSALDQRRVARGHQAIRSGIGISTGDAVAGQIGSLDRLLYTVIGDAVNIAQRLETLTKDYQDYPILINGATAEALKSRNDVVLESLGPLSIKGRVEPVNVFAVIEWRKADRTVVRFAPDGQAVL